MKYRKKPVVIDAVQWTGENADELKEFMKDTYSGNFTFSGLSISTLEGEMMATVGDWIIKGISGEFYPCKPDIFKQTYESVDDQH